MWESRWEKDREDDEVEIIHPYEPSPSPYETGYYYGSKVHTIVRKHLSFQGAQNAHIFGCTIFTLGNERFN